MQAVAWFEMAVGNRGWVRVNHPELPGWLYVRFEDDDRGRLRPRDVFVEGSDAPLGAAHLRAVPLADLEAWVNGDEEASAGVRSRLAMAGPDLRTLAAAFSTSTPVHRSRGETGSAAGLRGRTHWVALSLVSQFKDENLREWGVLDEGERMPRPAVPKPRRPPVPPDWDATAERVTIRRPEGRALPDDFLADVAHAYTVLARDGQKPAPVIAAEADVPVTTVHRWIKEARRRGLLAPARRGATG